MEQKYSIGEVLATLGISRTTFLYYEKQGVITPRRDEENGYRYFYHSDITVLKECICLKNLGYSVSESVERLKSGEVLDADNVHTYQEKLRRQIAYTAAVEEQLREYEAILRRPTDLIEYVTPPEYVTLFSGCESGYHRINQSEDANALIRQMPLTGFLTTFDDDFWQGGGQTRSGRCIQSKFVPLAFPDEQVRPWSTFGDVPSLRTKIRWTDEAARRKKVAQLKEFIQAHGYEVCGQVVSLYNLFGREMDITVPVKKRSE